MKKTKPTKNGAERREKIFAFIYAMVSKPTPLKKIHKAMQRRNEFKKLEFSTFYNNVKILIAEEKIYCEVDRTLHPKKKPIFLIRAKVNLQP